MPMRHTADSPILTQFPIQWIGFVKTRREQRLSRGQEGFKKFQYYALENNTHIKLSYLLVHPFRQTP